MSRFIPRTTLAALLLALPGTAVLADGSSSVMPADTMPGPLKEVRFDQRIGEPLPLDLAFRDEAGRSVQLGDYFSESRTRPVILVFAYYHCPMLCDMVLDGLTSCLKTLSFDPGKDFDVVVVSIDPKETPAQAAAAKAETLARFQRPGVEAGWHFLTGPQASIDRLTRTVGFRYVYDAASNQYAHAAGVVLATGDGRISRYLLGIDFAPRDMRLGLIESAGNKLGTIVDQVLLYCFHYDPVMGRYSAMILNILRLAAAATVVGVVLLIVLLRRRERTVPEPVGAA